MPGFQSARTRELDLNLELTTVAKNFGTCKEEIFARHRPHGPRLAAYHHLVENCRVRVTEVATLMGVSPAAVTLGIRTLKQQMQKNAELQRAVEALTKN